jgi:Ras-related protein Rab-1A
MEKDYDYLFKLLLIGNTHVGKSNLLLRFSDNVFQDQFQPTIGVDFKIKTINLDDSVIKLQLWDTAGQERFRNITNSYYKGAHGVILVYDITNRQSFRDIEIWLEEIDKYATANITKMLVGNKLDLEDMRQIMREEGKQKAEELNVKFLETSAKESTNVDLAFHTMIREIKGLIEKGAQLPGSYIGRKNTNNVKSGIKIDTNGISSPSERKPEKKNCC